MTLDSLIMLAGAFIATLPFLGLPNSWDEKLFLAAGIFVIALGIVVRRREKRDSTAFVHGGHFVERGPGQDETLRSTPNQHGES